MPTNFPTSLKVERRGSITTWKGIIIEAIKVIYTAIAQGFLLFLLITQAAIQPNKIRRTKETTVIIAEVPKAYQKLKLEL